MLGAVFRALVSNEKRSSPQIKQLLNMLCRFASCFTRSSEKVSRMIPKIMLSWITMTTTNKENWKAQRSRKSNVSWVDSELQL